MFPPSQLYASEVPIQSAIIFNLHTLRAAKDAFIGRLTQTLIIKYLCDSRGCTQHLHVDLFSQVDAIKRATGEGVGKIG